jgi:hypothetical protein
MHVDPCWLLSDSFLFSLLQASVVLFAVGCAIREWIVRNRAGRGAATAQVTRGESSMKIFYGTYAAINGLLVAICLSVEVATGHRLLWVVIDTLAVVYICLLNPWFRNYLVRFAIYLTKLEER